jgi:REP element-mobilizing transposase RayT
LGDKLYQNKLERKAKAEYHVMLRGINKQQIFEEEDYEKFIQVLKECKAV